VPDIVQTIDRMIATAGLHGIFSVELKRDPRDGVAKVFDVNVRPWWFVEFATRCGVNVCGMAYRASLGGEIRPVTSYAAGRTCVFTYYDFGACRRMQRAGELTLAGWAGSWLRAAHTTFAIDDPLPFLRYDLMKLVEYVGKGPRRMARAVRRRFSLPRRRPSSVPMNKIS